MVERPASVVKELLENAIDARSSQIAIEIDRGGSSLIRISDNGVGINKDDLALAVSRHATSKLKTLAELEKIISLGFRGEALASISAVSKLLIQSKEQEQQQAWTINTGTDNDFANYKALPEPTAHPQGTTVEVRDLFFNTPARRKFMRTIKTEFRHIDDIVKRIALSRFDIAFKLTHNKKLVRNLPRAITEKAVAQRISKLFSSEFLSQSHKIDFTSAQFSHMGDIRLWGWVSNPGWHRKQPDWQYFYVNGRFIRDKLVNHALRQVYQDRLPAETYPAYILYLEIEPQQVDVNVHPTKHEVRFRQARLIHDFIYSALNQVTEPVSVIAPEQAQVDPKVTLASQDAWQENTYVNDYRRQASGRSAVSHYQDAQQSITTRKDVADHIKGLKNLYQGDSPEIKQKKPSLLPGRSLGCPIDNYLLTQMSSGEDKEQLLIIHIKRAQQFLLQKLFHPGQPMALLIPWTLSIPSADIERLLAFQTELSKWGVEFSQLSEQTVAIRAIPDLSGIPACRCDIDELVRQLLQLLEDNQRCSFSDPYPEFTTALTKSLRSETLNASQQQQFLSLLSETTDTLELKTPDWDGRVIWKILDESGLDKWFQAQD